MKRFCSVISAVCLMAYCVATADVKPASIFSSDMVLQQEKLIKIWGTAAPAETVTVTVTRN